MDGLAQDDVETPDAGAGGDIGVVQEEPASTGREQHKDLVRKVNRHYAYYGLVGNYRRLSCPNEARRRWQVLARPSRREEALHLGLLQ